MNAAQTVLVGLVRAYRFALSPLLGSQCRFTPTCSAYALEALQRHGAWHGAGLSAWRVMRCGPWCAGGHDPVPAQRPLLTGLLPPAIDPPPTRDSSQSSSHPS